jgi:hypothetical protein
MKLDAEECDIWILRLTIAFVVSNVWGNGAPVNVQSTRTTAATLLGTYHEFGFSHTRFISVVNGAFNDEHVTQRGCFLIRTACCTLTYAFRSRVKLLRMLLTQSGSKDQCLILYDRLFDLQNAC